MSYESQIDHIYDIAIGTANGGLVALKAWGAGMLTSGDLRSVGITTIGISANLRVALSAITTPNIQRISENHKR